MGKVVTSVSLPDQVLAETEAAAREMHKSRSEVIKDALLGYLKDYKWKKMQEETQGYAMRQGIRTDADVENIIREVRGPKYGKR
jgi:metal-responsive CopG/Arc/MetJ family transcriptional regulator